MIRHIGNMHLSSLVFCFYRSLDVCKSFLSPYKACAWSVGASADPMKAQYIFRDRCYLCNILLQTVFVGGVVGWYMKGQVHNPDDSFLDNHELLPSVVAF